MEIKFTGIVREIKAWEKDKDGNLLSIDRVTHQITFLDRETGGDVVMTYPHDHGFSVGQDVNIKATIKPQIRNYKLSLYVQPVNTPVQAVPAVEAEKPKK